MSSSTIFKSLEGFPPVWILSTIEDHGMDSGPNSDWAGVKCFLTTLDVSDHWFLQVPVLPSRTKLCRRLLDVSPKSCWWLCTTNSWNTFSQHCLLQSVGPLAAGFLSVTIRGKVICSWSYLERRMMTQHAQCLVDVISPFSVFESALAQVETCTINLLGVCPTPPPPPSNGWKCQKNKRSFSERWHASPFWPLASWSLSSGGVT